MRGGIGTRRDYEMAGFRAPNYDGSVFGGFDDPDSEARDRQRQAHDSGFYAGPLQERLEGMDAGLRAEYRAEIARQVDIEMQKHSAALQRLGILVGFTSVILIQALVFLSSDLGRHPGVNAAYAAGVLVLFAICLDGVLVLISQKMSAPSSGAHPWDLEDLLRSGDHGSLSRMIESGLYRSVDNAVIVNHGINRQIGQIGRWLILGIAVVIVAIALELFLL